MSSEILREQAFGDHEANAEFALEMYQNARYFLDLRLTEAWDPTLPPEHRAFDRNDFEHARMQTAMLCRIAGGYALQNLQRQELENIAKDEITESLIPKAFQSLLSSLEEENIFEALQSNDWEIQVCLLDLDKLGQHNDLGGHEEGGNVAIEKTGKTLRNLFKRNGGSETLDLADDKELPTYSEHKAQIIKAVKEGRMHDVLIRLGGDEFLSISFLPTSENEKRQGKNTVNDEVERIKKAFSEVKVNYRPKRESGVSKAKMTTDGLVIKTTPLEDGTVDAELTTTFCVTRITSPTKSKILDVISELDSSIKAVKASRDGLETVGCIHGDYI